MELKENMKVKLVKGSDNGNFALWCAGRVPVGLVGTIRKFKVNTGAEMFGIKWDKPWRVQDKNNRYIFGVTEHSDFISAV